MNNTYSTVKALVLRERNFKENDKILTVLTAEAGKQTYIASGARRKGSRIKSACQQLTFNEFTVFEYKDWTSVNEAETIEPFTGLRNDLDKLFLAAYISELTEVIADEDCANPALLQLVLNTLYAVSELDMDLALVKAAFELRIMCLAGYEPMLDGCCVCSSEKPDVINLQQGSVHCVACSSATGAGELVNMPFPVYEAMKHIVSCNPKRIFSFSLDKPYLKKLGEITEKYVTTQLERRFETLDLYLSLQNGV